MVKKATESPEAKESTKAMPPELIGTTHEITQAVYWIEGGYGGGHRCGSMQEAIGKAEECFRLGYGSANGKSGEVRIVETTRRVYVVKRMPLGVEQEGRKDG